MLVKCYGGPKDGGLEELEDSAMGGTVYSYSRNLVVKAPNASVYCEYVLNKCRNRLTFLRYSKVTFKDLKK